MSDVVYTEPETREGDLAAAIQSVGLPHDAPWGQVVTALLGNDLGHVLTAAPASTDDAQESSQGEPASAEQEPAPSADLSGGGAPAPAAAATSEQAPVPDALSELVERLRGFRDDLSAFIDKIASS